MFRWSGVRRVFSVRPWLVAAIFLLLCAMPILAESEEEQIQRLINENNRMLEMSKSATKPLESEVQKLVQRITSAQSQVKNLQRVQQEKEQEIQSQERELADQIALFSARVNRQYRYARSYSPLAVLLTTKVNSESQQALKYTLTLAQRDQQEIDGIGQTILNLQKSKQQAKEQEARLASLQKQLDSQKQFFDKEIAGAKKYQAELQATIAKLSAQQQAIIAAKTGTAQTTVGDIPLTGDPNARVDFNPGFSPAFAAFSFGAPHYKGMSQYGAFGRAKAGQNYETILKAYYGDVEIVETDMPGSITVDGVGSIPFEDKYLKGIAEMPASWADQGGYEALKAQAIAARTYALARTGWRLNDKSIKSSICATEACQVYTNAKYSAGGRWHDAVNDTKGKVVKSRSGGDIFSTWYASTAGGHTLSYSSLGHTTPNLWDTTSDWSKWADGAYEKQSPWFFTGWYKDRSGDKCGRSHPWLNQEEFADILNAWVVRRHASGSELDRVAPLGPCWGGNPYSLGEMREKAKSYGEEYTSVSSVSVSHSQAGSTTQVTLQTNRGEVKINGSEFKEIFNLRAPGRISIKGKLFSIEKK